MERILTGGGCILYIRILLKSTYGYSNKNLK